MIGFDDAPVPENARENVTMCRVRNWLRSFTVRIPATLVRAIQRSFGAALAAILASMANAPAAEVFPSRPITIIVPAAPGGPTDVIGRVVAEGMRSSLGQPIIIENVTGAAGSIGVGRVARASSASRDCTVGSARAATAAAFQTPVPKSEIFTLRIFGGIIPNRL